MQGSSNGEECCRWEGEGVFIEEGLEGYVRRNVAYRSVH